MKKSISSICLLLLSYVMLAQEQTITSQFVVFKVTPKNSVIFIDDDEPRTLNAEGILSVRLKRGKHTYRITANSFFPESGGIEVGNEKVIKEITLNSAKATLTVKTTTDAEIWINGVRKGVGQWSGEMENGFYLIEARKPSHRLTRQEITLGQLEQRTITLAAPTPIYGSLQIESDPMESDVYMDNELIGHTPLIKNQILIGDHLLRLEKKGYRSKEAKITIEEGKTNSQNYSLQK